MMGMDHLDQVMQIKCYLSSGKEAKLDAALGDTKIVVKSQMHAKTLSQL